MTTNTFDWSDHIIGVQDNKFGSSRGGRTIQGAVWHHTASTGNSLNYVANWNERYSHPTYHVNKAGGTTGVVHPSRRPTSTGNIDLDAITFEIDNSTAAPNWEVTAASLESAKIVTFDHYARSEKRGNGFAINQVGVVQSEFWIARHDQYRSVECPGPTIRNALPGIIAELNTWSLINPGKEIEEMANSIGQTYVIPDMNNTALLVSANGHVHIKGWDNLEMINKALGIQHKVTTYAEILPLLAYVNELNRHGSELVSDADLAKALQK